MDEIVTSLDASDGVSLLVRHWPAENPWAAMLIVHGISEHCGRWGHVGGFFAEHGVDAWSFDLRGHGRSGGRRMYVDDFSDYAGDVATVYEHHIAPLRLPWVLYGHSMGGLIATGYLLGDLPRPDAAVLSAPALDADVPGYLRVATMVLGTIAPGVRVKSSIVGEHLSKDPAVGEAYLADPLVDLRTSARLGKEFIIEEQPAMRARAAEVSVPTFVIHGADDRLVPPRASAPLAASPHVERKLYPGLRHELHNEPERDQVLGDVLGFIHRTLGHADP